MYLNAKQHLQRFHQQKQSQGQCTANGYNHNKRASSAYREVPELHFLVLAIEADDKNSQTDGKHRGHYCNQLWYGKAVNLSQIN